MSTITKETLKDSNSCRLCGCGATEGGNDLCGSKQNGSFYPLYDKYSFKKVQVQEGESEPIEDNLDEIINRYLPIKVLRTDPYFPQVVCSSCIVSLEETVHFFNKLLEGQRLLLNIINQAPKLNAELSGSSTHEFMYEQKENILLQSLPKRRGRPKGSQRNKKVEIPCTVPEVGIGDNSESAAEVKPKRIRKPPERYTPLTSVTAIEPLENNPETCQRSVPNLEATKEILPEPQINTGDVSMPDAHRRSVCGQPTEDGSVARTIEKCTGQIGDDDIRVVRVVEEPEDMESASPSDHESDTSVQTADLLTPSRRNQYRRRRKAGKQARLQFKCKDCDKTYTHKNSLRCHRLIYHSDPTERKIFECEVCGKPFASRTLLASHVGTHSTAKPFKCELCTAKFKSKSSLSTHRSSIHSGKDKPFHCNICGNQFSLASSLKAHMRLHTNEKPFVCEFCNKAFTQQSNMREHRRLHTGERPHKCSWPDCEKTFVTSTQLRVHERSHNSAKMFYCDICGKGLTNSLTLKWHIKRHLNQKDVECSTCTKRFYTKWALKLHTRVHTGEKPYQCHQCEKTFSNKTNCEKHYKNVHIIAEDNLTTLPKNGSGQYEGISMLRAAGETASAQDHNKQASSILALSGHSGSSNNDDSDQQIIYIYPETLPIYTVTLEDNQAIEVQGPDGSYQMLRNLDQVAFATIDSTEGLGTQFFNLELDTSTLAPAPVGQLTTDSTEPLLPISSQCSEAASDVEQSASSTPKL